MFFDHLRMQGIDLLLKIVPVDDLVFSDAIRTVSSGITKLATSTIRRMSIQPRR